MSDKIQALYNKALSQRPKYFDKHGHEDYEPDHEFNLVKEVAEMHAAAEVDRLLGCLAETGWKDDGGMGFHFSFTERGQFIWDHADETELHNDGKTSLLEYIGFSGGDA